MTTQIQELSNPNIISVNGKDYEASSLSETAKSLITVYNQWTKDHAEAVEALQAAKLSVAKNEAALRDLSAEIISVVEASAVEAPLDAVELELVPV